MNITLYIVAGLIALSALLNVGKIGKPCTPLTHGMAITILVLNAAIATIIVLAAGDLH